MFFPISLSYDFGDAPDPPYATLLANNGARHILGSGLWLGSTVDAEPDGQPSPPTLGDTEDEHGVVVRGSGSIMPGGTFEYEVTASGVGYLNAWMDWNANGVWEATQEEHIFADQHLLPGVNVFGRDIPMSVAHARPNYARFRFSKEGGIPHKGYVPNGEVEDYAICVNQPVNITGWVYDDENWSGTKDPDELALSGATVSLSDATGTVATAIIEDGPYSFRAYELRQYYLQVTVPERYYMTTPDSASLPATAFGTEITNNFGASNIYEIEGVVYEDTNANGSWDNGEAGIPGVGIVLRLGGDGQVGETVTDAFGVFFSASGTPGRTRWMR